MTHEERYRKLNIDGVFKRAKENTIYLTATYNNMVNSPLFQPDPKIALTKSLLMHACISYEIDLLRWLPFHDIRIPNNYKRAGFIFKWISKMRPVRSVAPPEKERPYEAAANSYYSLLAAIGELDDIDMAKFGNSDEIQEILYSSNYRDIQPSCWAIIFSLVEKYFK